MILLFKFKIKEEFNVDKIIVYLAIKYKGDWDAIYKAINKKEQVNREEIDRV